MKTPRTFLLAPLLLAGCDASPTKQSTAPHAAAAVPKATATATKTLPAPGCTAAIAVSLNRSLMTRESGECG